MVSGAYKSAYGENREISEVMDRVFISYLYIPLFKLLSISNNLHPCIIINAKTNIVE